MTEQVDLDALEALIVAYKNFDWWSDERGSVGDEIVDQIPALIAELRQERERADALKGDFDAFQKIAGVNYRDKVAALSRAEETIDRIDGEVKNFEQSDNDALCEIERHLTEYDKQKGADRG